MIMKRFFLNLVKNIEQTTDKLAKSLNVERDKEDKFFSQSQYFDTSKSYPRSPLSILISEIEHLLENPEDDISHNIFYSELKQCICKIEAFMERESSLEKEKLITDVHQIVSLFLLFNYLQKRQYLKPLLTKRSQLSYIDDYGDIDNSSWNAELNRFARKHTFDVNRFQNENTTQAMRDSFVSFGKHFATEYEYEEDEFAILPMMISLVLDAVDSEELMSDESRHNLSIITDPYEYENAVSKVINEAGADARVTQGSGDQGADVIAIYKGECYVIQCKLYSQPVGNKAVQEVSAAKYFYDGDYALVVTNNSFTKSARMLASKLNVMLLHHSQIAEVFGGEDVESVSENSSYGAMMEALSSPNTERLKCHASQFLDTFNASVSDNIFLFDIGNCSCYVACFSSDDDNVVLTYLDYLSALTSELSYDEKILFTLNDYGESIFEYADALDIRILNDEKILDYLQDLIDIHEDDD